MSSCHYGSTFTTTSISSTTPEFTPRRVPAEASLFARCCRARSSAADGPGEAFRQAWPTALRVAEAVEKVSFEHVLAVVARSISVVKVSFEHIFEFEQIRALSNVKEADDACGVAVDHKPTMRGEARGVLSRLNPNAAKPQLHASSETPPAPTATHSHHMPVFSPPPSPSPVAV